MIGTREHACHVVVVGAEEYCEECVSWVEFGEGGFIWHVVGEEGGDGVENVGQCPGLGGVACPAVLAGFAGPILASPHCVQSHRRSKGQQSNLICGTGILKLF
jgi:hypothetical protein